MNRRSAALWGCSLGLAAAMACRATAPSDAGAPQDSDPADVPQSRQEFVDLLQPLPDQALSVTYEIRGAGGLTGELEVTVQRGGLRREEWTVSVPIGADERVQVSGQTVRNLDRVWSVSQGQDMILARSPVGALASAYMGLPPGEREQVATAVRSWHAEVRRASTDASQDRESVAGQPCQPLHIATQSVCLWEQTGLPLSYGAHQFELRATAIDRNPTVTPSTFTLPPGSVDAPLAAGLAGFSPEDALAQLREGEVPTVLLALQAAVLFPTAEGGQESPP